MEFKFIILFFIKMNTNIKYSIYHVLIFVLLVTIISDECDRSTPIRTTDGSCVLRFCTEEEFNNEVCTIDNQIAKTQYLNNIILLDEPQSYVSNIDITKYSNGDLYH